MLASLRRPRLRRILCLLAGAGVLALPGQAFGCWNDCVNTYGLTRYMYDAWWEMVYCIQTYPDGASAPQTTCYYQRFEEFE
jgi:hypothetical protein